MIVKVFAIAALVALPFSLTFWYRSHSRPEQFRYDVTPFKSMRVYVKDGICALNLLSMPTKTANIGEFRTPLEKDPPGIVGSLMFSSLRRGPYRMTWFVFPFWLTSGVFAAVTMLPVVRGPVRQWWRRLHGWCLECGYDLQGNRSGRCPECGVRFR